MSQVGGQFQQRAICDADQSAEPVTSQIALVYGANGGADQVYFSWQDDGLRELPMVWLEPQKAWGASPFDRHATGSFSREMTIRCVECHNTWVHHEPGSRNQYQHDGMILGVTCEVCHGPGREHVSFHESHPDAREPAAVVRPATLPRERVMDLCAQCHSNAIKHRGRAFEYRPGKPLDECYYTLRTANPEEDHVANQTTYLRQSQCFQNSDSMTCVTCHDPHRPRPAGNAARDSCARCHQEEDCTDRPRLPAGVQNECIACHMPQRRKIQVFFELQNDKYVSPVKRYEHKIGVYPLARSEVLLEWHRRQSDPASRAEGERLTKELAEAWRSTAIGMQAEHRLLAAIDACRESLRFEKTPECEAQLRQLTDTLSAADADYQQAQANDRDGRHTQAIEGYLRVLKARPRYAMAHARLGTAYASVGEKMLARQHLQTAVECDPDEPYAPAMLGWLAFLDRQYEQSLQWYEKADRVEPYSFQIHFQMGLALGHLDRWSEAAERLVKATKIEPKNPGAFLEASRALQKQGKPAEAVLHAIRAADLTDNRQPAILLNLAEAYESDGHRAKALEAAELALTNAGADAILSAQIRIRLEEMKNRK
jgi:tetratricopeptide (TPR) repeat protein